MELSWLFYSLVAVISCTCAQQPLTSSDRLAIIDQLFLHQSYIDNDASYASAMKWLSLYWSDATFTAIDAFGSSTRNGSNPADNQGIKYFYDYDHSVFPLASWFHTVGRYEFLDIDTDVLVPLYDDNNQTRVLWRWRVDWKTNTTGAVSTGTYSDVFENRNGVWKCLNRVSQIDGNWQTWIFQPYSETADVRFKSSEPTNGTSVT